MSIWRGWTVLTGIVGIHNTVSLFICFATVHILWRWQSSFGGWVRQQWGSCCGCKGLWRVVIWRIVLAQQWMTFMWTWIHAEIKITIKWVKKTSLKCTLSLHIIKASCYIIFVAQLPVVRRWWEESSFCSCESCPRTSRWGLASCRRWRCRRRSSKHARVTVLHSLPWKQRKRLLKHRVKLHLYLTVTVGWSNEQKKCNNNLFFHIY